jgi:transposase
LPVPIIELIRNSLKGERFVRAEECFQIFRSRPHGQVAAVLGTLRKIGLSKMIYSKRNRQRDLVEAMVVSRLISPCSKLATARNLKEETLASSLGQLLDLQELEEDELYAAMDWLLSRQQKIESSLAREHFSEGSLVFYDVSSSYFEGRKCPLAFLGHSRDEVSGKLQIVYGLLCNQEGCPVSVEVFEGNTADPKTLGAQVQKIRERFHLRRLVIVGDRGMITEARIREDLRGIEGLEWITSLRAPTIQQLVNSGALQLTLFDETDLAEIIHPDYPQERLIACRNPLLAAERARKRKDLIQGTERLLDAIVQATQRTSRKLKGKDKIALRVGRVINHYKVAKYFDCEIEEDSFSYSHNQKKIQQDALLDGIYVIRTSVPKNVLESEQVVSAYKNLSVVERAFRSLKTIDLKVRPIYHRLADRVRAHVFLCMLAYYVEWHMRKALAPILFDDHDKESAKSQRTSVVAPARRSKKALQKMHSKQTEDGIPVHSFQTLLKDLATLTKNDVRTTTVPDAALEMFSTPTPLQKQAFKLLGISYKM